VLTCRNSVDLKDLNVVQQLVLYFFPVITNLCFVNIGLVFIRLSCFEKRLKSLGMRSWPAPSWNRFGSTKCLPFCLSRSQACKEGVATMARFNEAPPQSIDNKSSHRRRHRARFYAIAEYIRNTLSR
jgi:hypothetical protein